MAVRVHVVAARDATAVEMNAAFAHVGEVESRGDGGWRVFTASVWGIGGDQIVAGLEKLAGPCVFITTIDGVCWTLRLYARGRTPVHLCHQFGWTAALAEEAPGPDRNDAEWLEDNLIEDADVPPFFRLDYMDEEERTSPVADAIDDLRTYGGEVPETLERKWLAMADEGAAIEAVRKWSVDSMLDALKEFGVPHDAGEIRAILDGSSVAKGELDTDIGNLPRFLIALGMKNTFSKWLEQQLTGDEDHDDEPEDSDEDEDDEDPDDANDDIQELGNDSLNAWLNVPTTDAVVFEGTFSAFLGGDVSALDEAIQGDVGVTDKEFNDAGFTLLGDIVCTKIPDTLIRGYLSPDKRAFGVQYVGILGQEGKELYTPLAGGGSLTTTSILGNISSTAARTYFRTLDDPDLSELQEEHEKGLAVLATIGLTSAPIVPTLEGLAQEIDAFCIRRPPED